MEISELAYIDENGYVFADYPAFRAALVAEYQLIYGADVYLEPDSQDGQFLSSLAKAMYDLASLGASNYASFSPVTAQGAGLSRLVKINGISRQIPSFSTVPVTIVGIADTVITNGTVRDTQGQKWDLPVTVTIPFGGSIVVTATAQEVGALNAAIGTVTEIFTPTQGWQTVTNATAATPGAAVESDAALRARQAQSVANPSLTVFQGTLGAVANVEGVTKLRGYENDTDVTDSDGIPAHTICVVVAGGDDVEIAQAIMDRKTPGIQTFGDVTELVYDDEGMPLNISFQRAVTATISSVVTIVAGPGWSADFEALIQASVAAAINAGRIGDTVLLNKLFAPAYLNGAPQGQTYSVSALTIAKNGGGQAAANITLDFDENPVCDPDTDVNVVVT